MNILKWNITVSVPVFSLYSSHFFGTGFVLYSSLTGFLFSFKFYLSFIHIGPLVMEAR